MKKAKEPTQLDKNILFSNSKLENLIGNHNKEFLEDVEKTIRHARNKAINECILKIRHARRDSTNITDYFGLVLKDLIEDLKKLRIDSN